MPKFNANLSMLFNEVDFLNRFEAASKAGFQGVEYLFPYDFRAEEIRERLDEFQLEQVLFNLPAGNWDSGDRGIACDPTRTEEFREGVDKAIEYAKVLDCRQCNVLAGIVPNGVPYQQAREQFKENLQYAAPRLKDAGIKTLIESINSRDIPGFFLTGTQQAKDVIHQTGTDNVFLQYDIYHMQIMEGDIVPTLRAELANIAHVQLADNPGRHEPGTGELNYPFIFEQLDDMGYSGWVGCEYKPLSNTESGLSWLTRLTNGGHAHE